MIGLWGQLLAKRRGRSPPQSNFNSIRLEAIILSGIAIIAIAKKPPMIFQSFSRKSFLDNRNWYLSPSHERVGAIRDARKSGDIANMTADC